MSLTRAHTLCLSVDDGDISTDSSGNGSPLSLPLCACVIGEPAEKGGDVARAVETATKGTKSLQPIHLEVSRASAGAIEAIEAQGGTVTCVHFNRLALRALVSWSVYVGVVSKVLRTSRRFLVQNLCVAYWCTRREAILAVVLVDSGKKK